MGREDEARAVVRTLLAVRPEAHISEGASAYRDPDFRRRFTDALLAAGLPE